MDLAQHHGLRVFQGKTRLIRALQAVLNTVLPAHLAQGVAVCGVRSGRLVCQLQTPVIRLALQAQHAVLLAAIRQVAPEVSSIDWIVRPVVSSASPLQHHQAQQAMAKGQVLSSGAQQHLAGLATRCRHAQLKSCLERILRRYSTQRLATK